MVNLDNGVCIELLADGGHFLGLGDVRCDGVCLRSPRRPMFVSIRNPSGVELCEYQLVRRTDSAEGTTLEFKMKQRDTGLMEWMVHTVRNRCSTADWTQPPVTAQGTTLTLVIRPVDRTIGNRRYAGFCYQYHYESLTIPVYKILDRATWELGGKAQGNEFWMRSSFVPSIVKMGSAEQFYSTEWYVADCANPNVFQFLPLQTELQGFSFTTAQEGILVTWPTCVSHVRSLFEKPRGCDEIVHLHEHCGDLAYQFTSAPIEVLFSPGETTRVDRANAYDDVRELVHDRLHAELEMGRDRVTTYGQIEEWGPADLARYAALGIPKLREAGVCYIELANHFQNNMNTWGVTNMCCTVDYKVAQSVGAENLRAFCRAARSAGIRVGMWGNTALSVLSWIFHKRCGPGEGIQFLPAEGSVMETLERSKSSFVRNPSGAIDADHYAPVFAVLNLRDPQVRDYWLKSWQAAHDDVGLEGIFLDSSCNISSDKFDYVQNTAIGSASGATADQAHLLGRYRPAQAPPAAITSQYRAHLELMVAMQRMGYCYVNEDLGVFGVHRHGPALPERLDNLFLWGDCLSCFDLPAIEAAGAIPEDVFFRALAYRMMWSIFWDPKSDSLSFRHSGVRGSYDVPTCWHTSLLQAFNEVSDQMSDRQILPGETGVLYRAGGSRVFWSFTDQTLSLGDPAHVRDVLSGDESQTSLLRAQARRVYVIEQLA